MTPGNMTNAAAKPHPVCSLKDLLGITWRTKGANSLWEMAPTCAAQAHKVFWGWLPLSIHIYRSFRQPSQHWNLQTVQFERKQGWAGGGKGFYPPRESDSELERSVRFRLQQLNAETVTSNVVSDDGCEKTETVKVNTLYFS